MVIWARGRRLQASLLVHRMRLSARSRRRPWCGRSRRLRRCRLTGLLKALLLQQGMLGSLLLLLCRLLRQLLLHHLRLRHAVGMYSLGLGLLLPQIHHLLLRHLRCAARRRERRRRRLRGDAQLLLPYTLEPVHRLGSVCAPVMFA